MVEKLTTCATCRAPLPKHEGPGRPAVYCSDPCRRAAEFRIRALVRRIEENENVRRGLEAGDVGSHHYMQEYERVKLMKFVKRWLAEDQAKLDALLGVTASDAPSRPLRGAKK